MTAPAPAGDAGTESTTPPAADAAGDESALGDAGKAALTAERRAKRAAEAALAAAQAKLTELENAGRTEAEKAQARADAAEKQLAELTLANLKREVADEVKLPANLAVRLVGSTRDELLADAKDLAKELPASPAGPVAAPGGKPVPTLTPQNGGTPTGTDLALNGDPLLASIKGKLGIR